jgi:hypothetical protein
MAIPERAPGLSGTSRAGFEASHAWSSAGPQKLRRPSLCSRPRTGVGPADRPAETPADCVSFPRSRSRVVRERRPHGATEDRAVDYAWTGGGPPAGGSFRADVSLPMEELKEES